MAKQKRKLNTLSFKVRSKAIREGEWLPLGDLVDANTIQPMILTKGYTDVYREQLQMRFGAINAKYRLTGKPIPEEESREILADLIAEFVIMDVKDLDDDETGEPMTIEVLRKKLTDPDYRPLYEQVLGAINAVGRIRVESVEDDAKN